MTQYAKIEEEIEIVDQLPAVVNIQLKVIPFKMAAGFGRKPSPRHPDPSKPVPSPRQALECTPAFSIGDGRILTAAATSGSIMNSQKAR